MAGRSGTRKPTSLPLGVTTAEEIFYFMNNLHSIPIGNGEPLHECHTLCWCHPVKDSESKNFYIHNAKDCREKWERQGVEMPPDSLWILVEEKVMITTYLNEDGLFEQLEQKPQPRFCKDCRHFYPTTDKKHRCCHESATVRTMDLVEGEIVTDMLYCSSMRVKGGVCGQEGRLWEENL